MADIVLEMKNISKSFGGVHALKGLDFELRLGEVHALLGENGAGKSTLIKVLGGIHQPDTGSIIIGGEPVLMKNVHAAQARGIGIIHQEIVLVPHLSVAQNIFLGREPTTAGLTNIRHIEAEARRMVAALGLDIDVSRPVASLSIAKQQMVEIVKAISFNVKILVMDEPTSSLSDEEVEKLFETIARLRARQVSIIYISHRMEELFRISDRVTVIRDGTYVGTRVTGETNADELVSMMVGRDLKNFYDRTYHDIGDVVLDVRNLSRDGVFDDVSFTVRRGEILGFSGLVGAGRSEVMTAIFGGTEFDSGTITLNGREVRFRTTRAAIDAGIGMVPEDRKKQGLILSDSVGYNLTLAALRHVMNGPFLSDRRKGLLIRTYFDSLRIKAASPNIEVSSLSGGNQQKVVLAKWLATKPNLLILDEPTRGVDVGAKHEIYSIMNHLAGQGLAIVMVSSDLPEVINMCDAVCVMRAGRIVARLAREELSQENIMKYATVGEEVPA